MAPQKTQRQEQQPNTIKMVSERTNYGRSVNYGKPVRVWARDIRSCLAAGFKPVDVTKARAESLVKDGFIDSVDQLYQPKSDKEE